MDTSPEYILQCEKAEEIQCLDPCKLHVFEAGNYYWHDGEVDIQEYDNPFENATWLPRQDQLQEMLSYKVPINLVYGIFEFSVVIRDQWQIRHDDEYASQFTSMEQLWLAFVMREKYNKSWDGKEWIINLKK